MGYIFISYSHKDKEYVHKLKDALQNEGFDSWIDDSIDYGDEWVKTIQKQLDGCDAFVLVMSKNSFESYMVQNEVARAYDKKRPIFPLLLDGDNWLIVQSKQYVDVIDGSLPTDKFFERLSHVTTRVKKITDSSLKKELPEPPPNIEDSLTKADELYYIAEYHKAIQLYREILRWDPENVRAKDRLAKAEIKQVQSEKRIELPRTAELYYRRARSYIAARDLSTAINLLNAAIQEAQTKGVDYSDAKEALRHAQDLLMSDEIKQKAHEALNHEQWKDALDLYNKVLMLDPTNEDTKMEANFVELSYKLRKRRVLTILFTPLSRAINTFEDIILVTNLDSPVYKLAKQQLPQLRIILITRLVLLFIFICILTIWLSPFSLPN